MTLRERWAQDWLKMKIALAHLGACAATMYSYVGNRRLPSVCTACTVNTMLARWGTSVTSNFNLPPSRTPMGGAASVEQLPANLDREAAREAAGEAFDKTAKILGLGYPGGPKVQALAEQGDAKAVPLPRPLLKSKEPHFSFAGLKSAVVRAHQSGAHRPEDIAASFQQAVVDCLRDRLEKAIGDHGSCANLVVAGGVAANTPIRAMLEQVAGEHDMVFTAPPQWLCTDNAAMIAWAGAERFAAGLTDPLDFVAKPRWPLDPTAEKARGAGVKA